MSDDTERGHYRWPLIGQIDVLIQEFEDDRSQFLQSRGEGGDWDAHKRLLGHVEDLAKFILRGARQFVTESPLPDEPKLFEAELRQYLREIKRHREKLIELVRDKLTDQATRSAVYRAIFDLPLQSEPPVDSLLRLVWETLSIDLAQDFISNVMGQGANRLLQVYELLIEAEPSPETMRFLQRVSRCFIWGFDAECTILCRGAIDTAFKSAVTTRDCEQIESPSAQYGYTLAQLIRVAEKLGIIDSSVAGDARWVNEGATTLAHESPVSGFNTVDIIRRTLRVIRVLAPS